MQRSFPTLRAAARWLLLAAVIPAYIYLWLMYGV